jgi:hypothetical protein
MERKSATSYGDALKIKFSVLPLSLSLQELKDKIHQVVEAIDQTHLMQKHEMSSHIFLM